MGVSVVWRGVERDPQPHRQPSTPICARPILVQSCHVPSVPEPSLTLMSSDAMASGCMPLGPQTLYKAYFIYFTPFFLKIMYYLCLTRMCCHCYVTMLYKKGHFCKNFIVKTC